MATTIDQESSYSSISTLKKYSELIREAIENSSAQKLTVSEIYKWMIENIPHCRENAGQTWDRS